MEQQELFEIANPCIQVCELDKQGYCKGCLRNRTERDLWLMMNDSQKRQVLKLLTIRRLKRLRAERLAQQTPTRTAQDDEINLTLFEDNENNVGDSLIK